MSQEAGGEAGEMKLPGPGQGGLAAEQGQNLRPGDTNAPP